MKTNPHVDRLVSEINAQRAQRLAEDPVFDRAESDAIESGMSPDKAQLAGIGAAMRFVGPERYWGKSS
jgi:hypothetical protein